MHADNPVSVSPPVRCSPHNLSLTDTHYGQLAGVGGGNASEGVRRLLLFWQHISTDDREWLQRVGEGSLRRGISRAIRYARAVRHDLGSVRTALLVEARVGEGIAGETTDAQTLRGALIAAAGAMTEIEKSLGEMVAKAEGD